MPFEGTQDPVRRMAAPRARLRRDEASAWKVSARDKWVEEQSAPFGLVRGNEGLQRSKGGAVSKGDKGARFHGPH